MRTLFAALFVAASAAGAWAVENDLKDLDSLQGAWKAKAGPNQDYLIVMEIKGHDVQSVITTPEGKDFTFKGELKLDDSTTPGQIDWIKFHKPDGTEAKPNLAIYKLKGDALTICQGGPGQPRPTEFKAGDDGPPAILEFHRQPKPEPGDTEKGDLKAFQGRWMTRIGPEKERPLAIEVQGRTVTATFTDSIGEELKLKGELSLDESTQPKQVDWVKFTRSDGSPLEAILGIYEFKDGALTICNGASGGARPTEFKAGDDGPPHLMVLHRDKDGK
ncbi:MAG: TIGR03067 domain-containing protein [Isosphaeraceae bacterium]